MVGIDDRPRIRVGRGEADFALALRPGEIAKNGHTGIGVYRYGPFFIGADAVQTHADLCVGAVQPRPGFDEAADFVRAVGERPLRPKRTFQHRPEQPKAAKTRPEALSANPISRGYVTQPQQVAAHIGGTGPNPHTLAGQPRGRTDAE